MKSQKQYEVIYTDKSDKMKIEHSWITWAYNKEDAKTRALWQFEDITIKRINKL